MRYYASHGCYDTEQRVGGRFSVDIQYTYDGTEVISSDDVTRAVSYLDVYEVVGEEMMKTSNTIEHVASRIINRLFSEFLLIETLKVTIYKITPPLGGDIDKVGVTLTAER